MGSFYKTDCLPLTHKHQAEKWEWRKVHPTTGDTRDSLPTRTADIVSPLTLIQSLSIKMSPLHTWYPYLLCLRGQESASHSLFLLRQRAESTSWARKAEGRHVTNSLQHWCGNSGTLHAKTDWAKDLKATKGPGERQLWLGSVLWSRYWSYSTL